MSPTAIHRLPNWALGLLFLTGLVAGFVDAIAGGGGLITLPVVLSLGIPPKFALGTNKFQATFGSASAAVHYSRAGVVSWRECKLGVLFTVIGAITGTLLVQQLDPGFLKHFIPVLLLLIAGYMFFRPTLGDADVRPRMAGGNFYAMAGLALGFYDGFIGPGVGTFWTMAFVIGLGFNLTKATGYTKVMNAASNVASLAFFIKAGEVYYAAGIAMGLGQLIGAQAGSHLVVKKGTRFIRPIFLTVVLVVTARLIYNRLFLKRRHGASARQGILVT